MTPLPRTDDQIAQLVQAFEGCTLPLGDWHHAEHLTVSLWYLRRLPREEAVERIRAGIQRFNGSHGLSGYHETLTLAWCRLIARFLAEQPDDLGDAELTRRLLEAGRDKLVLLEYYSREVIMTEQARKRWVPPDKQPLEWPAQPSKATRSSSQSATSIP